MVVSVICQTAVLLFEVLSASLTSTLPTKSLGCGCCAATQDKYGTQRVVSFLRQLTEQGGFWRASDKSWVKLNRVQFVGACNPPTDAGAHRLRKGSSQHTYHMLRLCLLVIVPSTSEVWRLSFETQQNGWTAPEGSPD